MNQAIKSGPRDVFMHILVMLALYFNAFNFIRLIFEYINIVIPDPLEFYRHSSSGIRWSIASLIIIYPLFIWASRFLHKDSAANPAKAELRIRKWLVYLTLFAAGLLIVGDLIALIFNFLEGDLTARFVLKILTVLVVAAAVFVYYLYDLRKQPGTFDNRAKIFVWAVSAVVAVSLITGFILAGSPMKQRLIRFDNQKISHLQILQSQIVNYWQQKDKLPADLGDLRDSISGFVPPVDPQTSESYNYQVTGALSFELCANFNLSSDASLISEPKPISSPRGEVSETWEHAAGTVCFSRTIDPDLYGLNNRVKPLIKN